MTRESEKGGRQKIKSKTTKNHRINENKIFILGIISNHKSTIEISMVV